MKLREHAPKTRLSHQLSLNDTLYGNALTIALTFLLSQLFSDLQYDFFITSKVTRMSYYCTIESAIYSVYGFFRVIVPGGVASLAWLLRSRLGSIPDRVLWALFTFVSPLLVWDCVAVVSVACASSNFEGSTSPVDSKRILEVDLRLPHIGILVILVLSLRRSLTFKR